MSNPFFTSRKAALEEEEASRGVLDNSQKYLDAIDAMPLQTPRLNNDGTVNETDLYRMQQTMIPVPGTENQFMLPERADAIAQIQQAQQMAAMAQDKFQKNNATMSDVFAEAGNTLFGPFNVLAGGSMKPFGDPSEEQLTRSQAATLAASNTARDVFNELRQARIDRSAAVSGALGKPVGSPYKGADGTMKVTVQNPDGTIGTQSLPGSEYANDILTVQGSPMALNRGEGGAVTASPVLTNTQAQGAGTQTGLARAAEAEAQADIQAVYNAPEAVAGFQTQISEVDDILKTFEPYVGANKWNPAKFFPGSEAYDFARRLDKVSSGSFITGFQELKGAGPITDMEGTAAKEALAMLDPGQSPDQFRAAAEAYRAVLLRGLQRAMDAAKRDLESVDAFQERQRVRSLEQKLKERGIDL